MSSTSEPAPAASVAVGSLVTKYMISARTSARELEPMMYAYTQKNHEVRRCRTLSSSNMPRKVAVAGASSRR